MPIKYKPCYCVLYFSPQMFSKTYFSALFNCNTRSFITSRLPCCFLYSKCMTSPSSGIFFSNLTNFKSICILLLHRRPSFMKRPSIQLWNVSLNASKIWLMTKALLVQLWQPVLDTKFCFYNRNKEARWLGRVLMSREDMMQKQL